MISGDRTCRSTSTHVLLFMKLLILIPTPGPKSTIISSLPFPSISPVVMISEDRLSRSTHSLSFFQIRIPLLVPKSTITSSNPLSSMSPQTIISEDPRSFCSHSSLFFQIQIPLRLPWPWPKSTIISSLPLPSISPDCHDFWRLIVQIYQCAVVQDALDTYAWAKINCNVICNSTGY